MIDEPQRDDDSDPDWTSSHRQRASRDPSGSDRSGRPGRFRGRRGADGARRSGDQHTPAGHAGPHGSASVGPGRRPRRSKRAKRRRTGWRRIVPTWRVVLFTGLGVVVAVVGGFALGYWLVDIPAANAAATAQSNVFLYEDGTQIAKDGDINRESVSLKRIPRHVQRAVLAAEDREFYSESAVDPQAMIRGGWNTLTGKGRQSGSTITQQYVKNYYLGQEQTVSRKVKEFFIAVKLDHEETKDEILKGYLNTSYFGRNAYGIQAAAQAYYGIDANRLDASQGAYLAALLNAPSAYDVEAHPENKARAVARWNYVLDGMVAERWLSPAARAKMNFPTPRKAKAVSGLSGQRGYVMQAVKAYLTAHHIIDGNAHGYRITTTLRKKQQDAFVKAVEDHLLSKADASKRKADRNVRAGGAAIDPATGKVIAMYGGVDYTKQYMNNATRRDYQVGSAFKPFVFAAAVQNDSVSQSGETITPNTVYDGTDRRPVNGWRGARYAPQNEDNVSYGPINVRTATDRSVNAVYAQMAVDVGPSKVKATAIRLGLPENTNDMPEGPAIALGTATTSVLDMAQAYATLADHGRRHPYTLVEKVTREGRNVPLPERRTTQAVNREAADTTTAVLQGVVEGGTGTAAGAADRPAAGKTGTAENDRAAWFAGYTPDLATVVAVMGQNPDTGVHTPLYGALGQPRINGGGPPAEIWAQFTAAALQGRPARDFDLHLQEGAEEEEPVASTDPSAAETEAGEPTADGDHEKRRGEEPGRHDPPRKRSQSPPTGPARPRDRGSTGTAHGADGRPGTPAASAPPSHRHAAPGGAGAESTGREEPDH